MKGIRFSKYIPQPGGGSPFEQLLKLFMQLINYTAGDVAEALSWMNELDREHKFTNDDYGMGDFIKDFETYTVMDCGHWTQQEKPDDVNRLMLGWLDRRFPK